MRFLDFITEKKLLDIYNEKIAYTTSVGIDKVNNYEFKKNIIRNIKGIIRDISQNQYKFKNFKIILIPKNTQSMPRKVCVPTIRDRIVIEALKEYMYTCYEECSLNFGISNLISKFVDTYNGGSYKKYIKSDLTTFFDTINHKKLINKVRKKVEDNVAISMLEKVLENGQAYKDEPIQKNSIGVPQGLSISMLLANIYMIDTDRKFDKLENIQYYRYVDDIIIFCNKNAFFYYLKLKFEIVKNGLKLNRKKTEISKIHHPFTFLGYSLKEDCISVKKQSIQKLENSIERLFKRYKNNNNEKELVWRLNLRISGAICDNKKYGWLFYFNKINDLKLLYHLDNLIVKLKKRYNVENINNKTFVESYYQIKKRNINNNNYFFNVNKTQKKEKQNILINIGNFEESVVKNLSYKELNYNYRRVVFRCLKSLEMDLDTIS